MEARYAAPAPYLGGAGIYEAKEPRQSFWRSTKGKLTIGILAIVILAAIVGGAVGGALSNKKSGSNDNSIGAGSGSNVSSGLPGGATASDTTATGTGGADTGAKPTGSAPVGGATIGGVDNGANPTATSTTSASGPFPTSTRHSENGSDQSEGASTGDSRTPGSGNQSIGALYSTNGGHEVD